MQKLQLKFEKNYCRENPTREFIVLRAVTMFLYLFAALSIIAGLIAGFTIESITGYISGESFYSRWILLICFVLGVLGSFWFIVIAEIIKLFLCIHKNTYDTAKYSYVAAMMQQACNSPAEPQFPAVYEI